MAYKATHFGNIQERAKALGMKTTRVTTDGEARQFGGHEYVFTQADAIQKRIDNTLKRIDRISREAEIDRNTLNSRALLFGAMADVGIVALAIAAHFVI